jgi:two-component system cell cycle response regulator
MVRPAHEHILLIGDIRHELEPALAQAAPSARLTRVDNVFDAIAELTANGYSAVVANAEPIERRPEAAIRILRELTGDGRIILFGHPTLEPVARKMLEFGCDDYVVTPPNPSELQQIFGAPLMRLATQSGYNEAEGTERGETVGEAPATNPDNAAGNGTADNGAATSVLRTVPLADVMLEALVQHPGAGPAAAVKAINAIISPAFELLYQANGRDPLSVDHFSCVHSLPVRVGTESVAHVHLGAKAEGDEAAMRHFLSHAAAALGKAAALQDRHNRLYKLAITDHLTGVYNRRHFELFLASILERAKTMRFQVTLLLFDIDNFKKYNDECGHALGDEILKETAGLMRQCCREHDLVARIGGDEFAVVFWEKELPRQPKDPARPVAPGRVPQEPLQILQRFRKTISTREFSELGVKGRGILTISGGLASFPWDGRSVAELVEAADRALTFGAKKGGKNSIYLVGGDAQKWEEEA